MKTDRELLELAAKAAGIEVVTPTMINYGQWNPLTDDGDALRLAVKLCIAPIQHNDEKLCAAYWTDVMCCHCSYGDDPYAATRRAIVRAAAAIGESMS